MAFVKARTSFFGAGQDSMGAPVEVDIAQGQVIRDDHPAVKGREHLFEPLEDDRPSRRSRNSE